MDDNPIKTIILSILFFLFLLFEWYCSCFIYDVFATKLSELTLGLIFFGLVAIVAFIIVAIVTFLLPIEIFD